MAAAIGWNVIDLLTGDGVGRRGDAGEVIGLAFHVASIGLLLLAYREFWARVRRGALLKAAAMLVAGMAVGILIGLGSAGTVPRHAGARGPVPVRAQPGQRFAGAGRRRSSPATRRCWSTRCSACSARSP